ncbi:hypothetical protein BOTBODRAFT_112983 [Botryobasidium botryosum FD-172 SS1]|uniref:Zn(2)-C6 fungal-type domain-containing protein n=1 Tax=Botryobasidium botryosum (strain FD-172 SS1) TaxID=930990 RepID=A0A067MKG3_BOTB1|nr:hypothetical protein BOTBODRAFT_112983 [Botryobasidium botryosum FD-172 SS1]
MEHQQPSLAPPPSAPASSSGKAPVVRGARACTVCRQAKMRCIGADDGARACQRCKKGNLECVFEKHRRGRKPGSKLSEASKMLRRLEKGLSNAKLKSQASTSASQMPFPVSASRTGSSQSQEYPQMAYPQPRGAYPPNPEQLAAEPANDSMSGEEDEDDDHDSNDKSDDGLFPSRLLAKERRHSFFRTILNPSDPAGEENHPEPGSSPGIDRKDGLHDSPLMTPTIASVPGLDDPISAGLIDEADAKVLFDLVFLRLNPFINLFDPVLHTVAHVRSRCPFLFTCLIMAGTKFWKPELYKKTQKLAIDFSVRAFQDAWKRVEVVQAFACLTYWKEPDDTRTWTYIGYACRLAVELNLNRYVSHPPENETEHQKRERRNRERTYLVLFVHDRSLSMQTGRQWMLPEDDLVRHSSTWHEDNFIRPEDVIVSAFVQLRRIAAETTDVFYLNRDRGSPGSLHADVNYEILLHGCNGKLTHWMETWQGEMKKASGNQPFHFSMLSFFRLHVRLFLNSFGLQSSMAAASRASPSLQALSACYTSALQTLQIVTNEFAPVGMLRYGQDSITVMTAYSAVFLLRVSSYDNGPDKTS